MEQFLGRLPVILENENLKKKFMWQSVDFE